MQICCIISTSEYYCSISFNELNCTVTETERNVENITSSTISNTRVNLPWQYDSNRKEIIEV